MSKGLDTPHKRGGVVLKIGTGWYPQKADFFKTESSSGLWDKPSRSQYLCDRATEVQNKESGNGLYKNAVIVVYSY